MCIDEPRQQGVIRAENSLRHVEPGLELRDRPDRRDAPGSHRHRLTFERSRAWRDGQQPAGHDQEVSGLHAVRQGLEKRKNAGKIGSGVYRDRLWGWNQIGYTARTA
jgi:hypothetical protein